MRRPDHHRVAAAADAVTEEVEHIRIGCEESGFLCPTRAAEAEDVRGARIEEGGIAHRRADRDHVAADAHRPAETATAVGLDGHELGDLLPRFPSNSNTYAEPVLLPTSSSKGAPITAVVPLRETLHPKPSRLSPSASSCWFSTHVPSRSSNTYADPLPGAPISTVLPSTATEAPNCFAELGAEQQLLLDPFALRAPEDVCGAIRGPGQIRVRSADDGHRIAQRDARAELIVLTVGIGTSFCSNTTWEPTRR